jgi:RNA polymerase sigma factor (sigma-70 family)
MGRKIKPLEKKTDKTLVNIIKKTGDSAAYLELKKRNEKSFYSTCSSYCKRTGMNYEEIVKDVDFVFTKAIQSYSPHKNTKFNSWFTNHSRFWCLNKIRKSTEEDCFVPTEIQEIDFINNVNNEFHADDLKISHLREHLFNILESKIRDKRAHKIIRMRFFEDKRSAQWSNIAKEMKLTVQGCLDIYSKARDVLKKELEQI